jgi:hypothetical protein
VGCIKEEAKYNEMIHFSNALSVALICIGQTAQKMEYILKNSKNI